MRLYTVRQDIYMYTTLLCISPPFYFFLGSCFSVSTVLCVSVWTILLSLALCIFMILFRSLFFPPFFLTVLDLVDFFQPNRTPPSLISLNRVFSPLFFTPLNFSSDLRDMDPRTPASNNSPGMDVTSKLRKYVFRILFFFTLICWRGGCCCCCVGSWAGHLFTHFLFS